MCVCVRACRQGRVQFRPVCEELRVRYYRELKRFISIPNQFRGVYESDKGAESIFTAMIDNNSRAFITIYSNAEQLFSRLQQVQDKFRVSSHTRAPGQVCVCVCVCALNDVFW